MAAKEISQKSLDKYFAELRRIEEHREAGAEKNIYGTYRTLMKNLQEFLGVQYATLAEDDVLTYEILARKNKYARFLEEVEATVNNITPKSEKIIRSLIEDTYKTAYEGMVTAVSKSTNRKELKEKLSGIKLVPSDVIKRSVQNPVSGLTLKDTLEKHRKEIIYDIKQNITVGLMNGDRMSTMAKRISGSVDKNYRKAMLIARTEAHRVRESGHTDSAGDIDNILKDESDYRFVKIWKSMRDGSVRNTYKASHVKMEGQMVLEDEKFDLGGGITAPCPGSSGTAINDCNCRCYVSRKLMNDEEFFKATGRHFPENDNKEKKLEKQEQQLLDEQKQLTDEYDDIQAQMKTLENEEFVNIWKNPVTVKDYDTLKDRIPAKRDYFETHGRQDMLNLLDDFEIKGKQHLALKNDLANVNKKLSTISDDIKETRKQLMKVKKIDPDKMQAEIDDLTDKIKHTTGLTFDEDVLKKITYGFEDGWTYHTDPLAKDYLDDKFKNLKAKQAAGIITPIQQEALDELEEFFDKYKKATTLGDPKEIKKLQKQLKDKQDELERIRKRYGLEDDKFSQARKDNAYWFKDKQKADDVLRPSTGEVWKAASKDERLSAWDYTAGSGKFNRPLRGYEGSWYNFKGVGKVDLDYEGAKKEIERFTDLIGKSTYDFDIWLQRGIESSQGAASFLGIDESVWRNATNDELQDLVGKTVTDEAFVSCGSAKGEGFSGPLILNVYAPKGTKMIYAEPFSNYGNGAGKAWDGISTQSSFGSEFETIIQRGTSFRITKVERTGYRTYIDVEIVGQKY